MAQNPDGTLERLIRILSAFHAGQRELTVAQLAARAQLPVPTTYRWVDRLTTAGLLTRHRDGTIAPGLKLWELVSRAAPTSSLRSAALPFMDDVHQVLRQHTQLAILDDDGVLILERLSARGAVANQATVAGRLPLFTSSLGLVLLAFSRRHIVERFITTHREELGQPLTGPHAEATAAANAQAGGSARNVLNPTEAELRSRLAVIRKTGYASMHGHIDEETTGVSVPITYFDHTRSVSSHQEKHALAALGVVVPRYSDIAPGLAPLLMTAARAISRTMEERNIHL